MNNTTQSYLESEVHLHSASKNENITLFVVFTTIAVATYFGNILILVSLKKFRKHLKGTPYILLGNLAVADLLLAVGLTLGLIGSIFTSRKSNGYYCIVKIMITGTSLTASGNILLFISLDRCFAIVFPVKHLVHSRKTIYRRVKLVLVWAISVLAVVIPTTVSASSSKVNEGCKLKKLTPDFMSLFRSVFILLQFVINVVLCLVVMWRLQTNTMSRQKYKRSMIKCGLLIKVYVVFVICWLPYVLNTILLLMSEDKQKYVSFRKYSVIPGLMNSAMNWIIYGFANRKLRHAFKSVLLCLNTRQLNTTRYIHASSYRFNRKSQTSAIVETTA